MSDSSISIVPKKSEYENKESKAREILEWLISMDVIKDSLSDCILSSNFGFAVSEGAGVTTKDSDLLPFDLTVNGVEVIKNRQVFDTGQNGLDELLCPNCKENIANEEWSFFNDWDGGIGNNLTCPLCGNESDIHNYKFNPNWGFSDLGFTFWNWPQLTDES